MWRLFGLFLFFILSSSSLFCASEGLCFVTMALSGITKTHLFKYTENFTTKKIENFHIKNFDFFSLFLLKTWIMVLVRTASTRRF